jgi:hypothetical protein
MISFGYRYGYRYGIWMMDIGYGISTWVSLWDMDDGYGIWYIDMVIHHIDMVILDIDMGYGYDVASVTGQALRGDAPAPVEPPACAAGVRPLRRGGGARAVQAARGRAVQVDPIKPTLKALGTKPLKLKYDKLLSILLQFCFQFQRAPLQRGELHLPQRRPGVLPSGR